MDSYSDNAHGQIQPVRPHGIGGGLEEEQHHEKKSVMNQMKDKVKKMKNTIRKKAHGYGHNHEEHTPSEVEEEEEEEEEIEAETEAEADPEVHGAPSSDVVGESPISHSFQNMAISDEGQRLPEDKSKETSHVDEKEKETLKSPSVVTHGDKFSPQNTPRLTEDKPNQVVEKENETLMSPPSVTDDNYFSPENSRLTEDKPKEPTQFDVDEKEEEALKSPPTGTHGNNFSPENPPRLIEDEPNQVDEEEAAPMYTENLSSTPTAPKEATVYDKVSEAGTTVMGKVQPQTGPVKTTDTDTGTETETETGAGASMKGNLSDKLRPGDEDSASSDVISDALPAKKQEAVESHTTETEAGAEAEAAGGVGMVGRFTGMVSSFLGGAGSVTAPAAADEQARGPGQEVGSQALEEEDIKQKA